MATTLVSARLVHVHVVLADALKIFQRVRDQRAPVRQLGAGVDQIKALQLQVSALERRLEKGREAVAALNNL